MIATGLVPLACPYAKSAGAGIFLSPSPIQLSVGSDFQSTLPSATFKPDKYLEWLLRLSSVTFKTLFDFSCSICKWLGLPSRLSINLHCLQLSKPWQLSPSASPCLMPTRCSNADLNSANISSHLATWWDGSFLRHNHRSEA